MISGAYQGSLITEVIRRAISENMFSAEFKNGLRKWKY